MGGAGLEVCTRRISLSITTYIFDAAHSRVRVALGVPRGICQVSAYSTSAIMPLRWIQGADYNVFPRKDDDTSTHSPSRWSITIALFGYDGRREKRTIDESI